MTFMKHDFGAVIDDVHESNLCSIDLGDYVFDRASASETDRIRSKFISLTAHDFMPPRQTMVASETGLSSSTDPSQWRFCVVRPKATCETPTYKLEQALRISDADLMIGPWWQDTDEHVRTTSRGSAHITRLNDVSVPLHPLPFDARDLAAAVQDRNRLDDVEYPNLVVAIEQFAALDAIEVCDLKLLGYFAILESVLSHSPKSGESADTISRQLTRNAILIHHRCNANGGLGLDDGSCSEDKVIKKLYDLRSCIAHGNDSTAAKENLRQVLPDLASPYDLDGFLRKLLRRTLRRALIEPQLITDLKG